MDCSLGLKKVAVTERFGVWDEEGVKNVVFVFL